MEVTGGRKTRQETISKLQVGDKVNQNPNSDRAGQEWCGLKGDV